MVLPYQYGITLPICCYFKCSSFIINIFNCKHITNLHPSLIPMLDDQESNYQSWDHPDSKKISYIYEEQNVDWVTRVPDGWADRILDLLLLMITIIKQVYERTKQITFYETKGYATVVHKSKHSYKHFNNIQSQQKFFIIISYKVVINIVGIIIFKYKMLEIKLIVCIKGKENRITYSKLKVF